MSRTARAFQMTLATSGFGYAAQGLSLVAIPLFLGTVGVDAYGLMVTVMALTGYLNFADAGLSWGALILIAQANGRASQAEIASVLRHAVVLAAASGLVVVVAVAAVLIAAAHGLRLPMFASHPESDQLVLIAGLQLIVTLQFAIFYNLFQGLQEGHLTAIYQGAGRLGGLGASMLGAWLTHSIAVVMWIQLGGAALAGAAAAIHTWRRHPWAFQPGSWVDAEQYRVQLRVGAKTFLLQIGRTLGNTAPTLGISSVFGPALVPFYTVPTTLLGLFFNPINTWSASMQSAYGEAWTSGALEWARTAFRRSLERACLLGGLGLALFGVLGGSFIALWTHGKLTLGPAMTASVCAMVAVATLVTAGDYLLTGFNRHRRAAMAELANGVLAMILIPLVIRWLGAGAVGLGAVGATLLTAAWVLRREIRVHLGDTCFPTGGFLFRAGLAVAAAAAAAWAFSSDGPAGSLWAGVLHLALGGAAGLVVYGAAVVSLRLVGWADFAAVTQRFARGTALP
jgi:O-antigen/teichoic acid export membrane protein